MIKQLNIFGEEEQVKTKQADLQTKVRRAVALIKSMALPNGEPIEVAYSGGKDSDVVLELTRMAGIPYRAIYKNTTIDPPGTIHHAEQMGAEVLRPEQSFFQLIADMGFPNHQQRFCCRFLKEYKVFVVPSWAYANRKAQSAISGMKSQQSVATTDQRHQKTM